MMLQAEYSRLLEPEIKMTEVCVRELMGGGRFETYASSGRLVCFCLSLLGTVLFKLHEESKPHCLGNSV
jgi:hypothetical protein